MGYWNSRVDGSSLALEDTGLIWGDAPADIFDDAIEKIVEVFKEDVGRRPFKNEIISGLLFSLSIYEDENE